MTAIKCVHLGPYTDYDGKRAEWHCENRVTYHVLGYDLERPHGDPEDDGLVDVFTCDEHLEKISSDLTGLRVDGVNENFREGFEQGHKEALWVWSCLPGNSSGGTAMTTQQAWSLITMGAGTDLPDPVFEPRTPLGWQVGDPIPVMAAVMDEGIEVEGSHEWRWEQYLAGRGYGWRFGLVVAAQSVLDQTHQQQSGN